jgi:NTP pyrophosphatase (non-canonical NTP hydrolase)
MRIAILQKEAKLESSEVRSELLTLRALLREFVQERDWAKFHTPKNLATALSVEASELLEPFQWLNSGSSDELGAEKLSAVRHEMADVLAYLIQLADQLDVDLYQALIEKMELNRKKYPAEIVRGDARKYSDYS